MLWSVPPLLICAGAIAYHLVERWSWFDSLYVAVNTLTSLGGGDKHATSHKGRVLTLVLALVGISTIAVAGTELLGAILSGRLSLFLRSRKMTTRIDALQQHVIVCGYGHIGQHVAAELIAGGIAVVVVDRSDEALARAPDIGAYSVLGDASVEGTLRRAGVERARALLAVAGTDADNVLITMTARLLQPALPIVSRSENQTAIPKLLRAGATRTASPHAIAGEHIADVVLHPSALEAHLQLREEIVHPGGPLEGKTVGASGLRARGGAILIAIKHRDGHLAFNPEDDDRLGAGDIVITLNDGAREDPRDRRSVPT